MKASASTSRRSPRRKGRAPATFAAKARRSIDEPRVSLILFDIDGTLVLTGGAGVRAMSRAFEDLLGVRDAFRGMPMAGRTDSWILADAAAAHRVQPDSPALARFRDVYLEHLADEIHKPAASRKGIMPGVRDLLDALSGRTDVFLALLTGNYQAAARIKLEYFDLWRYFSCGAFGDSAPDRNGLLPRAVATVAACGGPSFAATDAVVIGDTPLDIACAAHSSARSIGVATGNHSVDELRAAGADVVFADLSDTDAVLRALGVER
ncbi:MAG TPA: HAD family hydrolase [Vicinamibacterales bacterium]|nr:HAD family hydrolase [Vicinamibacterales bacterium]